MDNHVEDDKEQWFWFVVVAVTIVGVVLGFGAVPPMLKVLLILALIGGCCFIAHRFHRLGSRFGYRRCEEDTKAKKRAAPVDVWECMHIQKGVLGGEVLTLKRDPSSSPPGLSDLYKKKYQRVIIAPAER